MFGSFYNFMFGSAPTGIDDITDVDTLLSIDDIGSDGSPGIVRKAMNLACRTAKRLTCKF